MVTLNSADNVLKSYYLDAISETLNMKVSPVLAKIERTSENVVGKEVRKTLRVGVHGGIGAGTEDGDLPTSRGMKYAQIVVPLKNLYGTIEISDKAIRASANNDGAFVNILNEEMDALVKTARFHFNRMLFGSGDGYLGEVTGLSNGKLYVSDVRNFAVGMHVSLLGAGVSGCDDLYVESVDYKGDSIVVDAEFNREADVLGAKFCLYGAEEQELSGFRSFFSEYGAYGMSWEELGAKPYMDDDFGEFSEDKLQEAMDYIEANSGHNVDMIVCSWGVRRIIKKYYMDRNLPVKTVQLDGGYSAMEIMGVPVVVDRFCPDGTMYLLSTDALKLCQLCDWQWLEAEDGKILKQVPGKPVYAATLVKYAELICENPAAQGMLSGIVGE